PFVELIALVAAARTFGTPQALLAVVLLSVVGAWLVKMAGIGVLRRLRATVARGEVPHQEMVHGVLLPCAGALLLLPAFVTRALRALPAHAGAHPRRAHRPVPARRCGPRRRHRAGPSSRIGRRRLRHRGRRRRGPRRAEGRRSSGSSAMTMLDPSHVEVRPAATVMLVRDGADGLEVFMVRRNPRSEFVAGAFVFPGGAVDDHDSHPSVPDHCTDLSDARASHALGLPNGGLAYWVAAIRETFEECGLLLAYGPDGRLVRFDDPAVEQRFLEHRRRVDAGELSLVELCRAEGLTLASDALHYFSH